MTGRALVPAVLVLGLACASNRGAVPGHRLDVITADEIASVDVQSTYDVIVRLRPNFLRSRGTLSSRGSVNDPAVYINGIRAQDGVDRLHSIPRQDVEEIRHLNAADANTRFGPGNSAGAILVTTRS